MKRYGKKLQLEKLARHKSASQYIHNVGKDNADAHMTGQIIQYIPF